MLICLQMSGYLIKIIQAIYCSWNGTMLLVLFADYWESGFTFILQIL